LPINRTNIELDEVRKRNQRTAGNPSDIVTEDYEAQNLGLEENENENEGSSSAEEIYIDVEEDLQDEHTPRTDLPDSPSTSHEPEVEEIDWSNQFLIYTDGRFLVLYNPEDPLSTEIRRATMPPREPGTETALCNLQYIPSLSMILTSGVRRLAWIHRLVYFPDEDIYDLIPEHRFAFTCSVPGGGHVIAWPDRNRIPWPWGHYLAGVVVQSRRVGQEESEYSAQWGVSVVVILENGEMSWWTVNKTSDDGVGIEEIVL
jgi:hypothetical protein